MRKIVMIGIGFTLGFAIADTAAQTNPTIRLRGTIDKVDGNVLFIKSREGQNFTVKLSDNYTVSVVIRASLADIKPNSFIGTAAIPMPDGTLKAIEIHIFPESMRGTGEGFRDFDLQPGSTMTNAAVTGRVDSTDGPVLTLTYKGGQQKVVVPTSAPVVTFEPGKKEDIQPGSGIIVFGLEKLHDDTFSANRITVGRNGINPPM